MEYHITMYIRRGLHVLCLIALFAGCSLTGQNKSAQQPLEEPPDLDAIFARRFALEDFEYRLDAARNFYSTENYYLFRTTRDSLLSDVNAYIRMNPQAEIEPEFERLFHMLDILDILTVATPERDSYAAEEDRLALQFADWPDMDLELDDGRIFSSYNSVFPELEDNRIDFWIRYFTGPGRARFERAIKRMQANRQTVEAILEEKGMPKELICIALIESGYTMTSVSSASAVGPWQFIRGTGKMYNMRMNWWFDERRDIVASTYAACNYLNDLYGIWGDWFLAFAAYNCGEYRVARQIARQKTDNFWNLNLPRQTQRYVPKFLATLYILRDPEKYDLTIPMMEPEVFDEVTVTDATDLKIIAQCAGTSIETIKKMNPQCLRSSTPPQMEIVLRVPRGKGEVCQQALDAIPASERITYRRHRVSKGETLSNLADRYGTSIAAIKQLNGIRNRNFIREGKSLLVPMKGAPAGAVASSKPGYKNHDRTINKKALEKYANRGAAPSGHKRLVYTVKAKDTLGHIAEAYKTSARRIRAWNNLSYRRYIYPGQKLAIYVPKSFNSPGVNVAKVSAPDESGHTRRLHTVKSGETLYSISKRYKVSLSELRAWNNKSRRGLIHPGEELTIWKKK